MKMPSLGLAGLAVAVAGVSVAAAPVGLGIAQLELAGQTHPDIWSNAWLRGALGLTAAGLVVAAVFFILATVRRDARTGVAGSDAEPEGGAAHSHSADEEVRESVGEDMSGEEAVRRPGPTFTGLWRHTADGFEASPLMNMANTAMPGHMSSRDRRPFVRFGVCVACDPIPPDASSSRIGARFVGFLSSAPVAGLISAVAGVGEGSAWTRLAGNGALRLEAMLGSGDEDAGPVASAMLLPPMAGMRFYGRVDGVACLWLHVEPRSQDGGAAKPAGLGEWYERLTQAVALAGAFAGFLAEDMGLGTRDDPAARVGVMLQAPGSMAELVDAGGLHVLPDAVQANQFLGYLIADPAGKRTRDAVRALLTQLCDHTMHLGDFDHVLAALGRPLPEAGCRVLVPWQGGKKPGIVTRSEGTGSAAHIIVAVKPPGTDEPMQLAFGADVVEAAEPE